MGDPTKQVHDWEPGIKPSGLFWTIPVRPETITADPKTGEARMHAKNVAVKDYHDFFNAVLGGGPAPVRSFVSFDVRWPGGGQRQKVRDEQFGFRGKFVPGPATVKFRARVEGSGVIYKSNSQGQYNPGPDQGGAGTPAVGFERNGVFF